jgi:SAM-dependent methyltransferase
MSGTSATKDKTRAFFNALAPKRERFIRRASAYHNDLQTFLRFTLRPEASVVELGCGIGNVLSRLPQRKKIGIDFAEEMIAVARTRDGTGTTYMTADVEDLPKRMEAPDYVLLLDTVNTLNDVQKAFCEIREKLCADHTRLVITFQNFLWRPLFTLAVRLGLMAPFPPQNWLTPEDVAVLLSLSGWEIVRHTERVLLPVPFPLLTSLCNRFLVKLPIFRWFALVHCVVARPVPRERKDYSISIIIPARNEAGNLRRAIESIPSMGSGAEVIMVEGNSTDDTWERMQALKKEYCGPHRLVIARQEGRGKGDAVRKGFSLATNDILCILDADLTVDPSELPKFYDALASGKGECINGSRLVYPMEDKAMRFLNLVGNKIFSWLFTWLLGQRLKDTLCGTKAILRKDYENVEKNRSYFGEFDPFGDFDLLFGAAKQNLKIIEIPVRYKERTYGQTNIQRWKHGWLLLRMCAVAARKLKFV